MEEPKPSLSITVTLSIDEYLSHARDRGNKWVVIDNSRRLEITNQPNWHESIFIEEIENSPAFKLWKLEDWKHNKAIIPDLVKEQRLADDKEASKKHAQLMTWKLEAVNKLVTKGKQPREKAEEYVKCCIDPLGRIKIEDFEDNIDLITGEKIKTKESKLAEKIKMIFDLRTKLNYPFPND